MIMNKEGMKTRDDNNDNDNDNNQTTSISIKFSTRCGRVSSAVSSDSCGSSTLAQSFKTPVMSRARYYADIQICRYRDQTHKQIPNHICFIFSGGAFDEKRNKVGSEEVVEGLSIEIITAVRCNEDEQRLQKFRCCLGLVSNSFKITESFFFLRNVKMKKEKMERETVILVCFSSCSGE